MAYKMGIDTYTCDYCGVEMKWDGEDERHGTMWECELCSKHFCTSCFRHVHGYDSFDTMLHEHQFILCPDCYGVKPYDPRHEGEKHG